MQPTAYLIIDTERPEAPGALWHAGTIEGAVNGVVHPLYKRDDIAPLRVPLIDQHDTFVGYETRRPDDLLRAEGYLDAADRRSLCARLRCPARQDGTGGEAGGVASLEEAQTLLEDR